MVLVGKRVELALGWSRTPAYYQSSFHNKGGRFRLGGRELGAKQALVRLSWPAVNQAGLDYHIGTRTLLHPSASFTSEACNGMQKGRKVQKSPQVMLNIIVVWQ